MQAWRDGGLLHFLEFNVQSKWHAYHGHNNATSNQRGAILKLHCSCAGPDPRLVKSMSSEKLEFFECAFGPILPSKSLGSLSSESEKLLCTHLTIPSLDE